MTKTSYVELIMPLVLTGSVIDSLLKEETWVPSGLKVVSFYILIPLTAFAMVLLIPYLGERIRIITPRRTSNYVLYVAAGVGLFQLLAWVFMYYLEAIGAPGLGSAAWFMKDLSLFTGAAVFVLLSTRLLRWYRKVPNVVVLFFGLFALGFASLAILLSLPDFLPQLNPFPLRDGIGLAFMFLMLGALTPLISMSRALFGRVWRRYSIMAGFILVPISASTLVISDLLGVTLEANLKTILVFILALAGPVYYLSYFRLVAVEENPTAKDYYKSVGYGMGILAATSCGIALGLRNQFPLSGFPSLAMLVPGSTLAFAGFSSSAAHFSISDDIRKQIRRSADFVASLGKAEMLISTEQGIRNFYDKFTGLAKESGAVEASAFTEKDIYSYVTSLKKMQQAEASNKPEC